MFYSDFLILLLESFSGNFFDFFSIVKFPTSFANFLEKHFVTNFFTSHRIGGNFNLFNRNKDPSTPGSLTS
jgi:hypothetical protein